VPSNAPPASNARFQVGEMVDYYSASQGQWIPAKVLQVNPSGTYNLDCKPEVPADKIRSRGGGGGGGSIGSTAAMPTQPLGSVGGGGGGGAAYNAGDMVEYYSASQGTWILAKVLQFNAARGTYNLDCKPEVTPDKIRPKGSAGSAAPPPAPSQSNGGAWNFMQNFGSSILPVGTQAQSTRLTSGSQTAPLQLLRVKNVGSRWQYEVCPEGAALLESYGSRRISVASICGLYRTGKSYLLNLLLERVQKGLPLFTVGNSTNACTTGLWLWGSVDSDDARSPVVAFLDCEGFGATSSDKTRDAQLMTLCALLSSVLILNTKGALNESMFNALALVCRFAEHVEERGNEASRPVLLWVLRDFMLELRDANGRATSPDEYLEQALHSAPTNNADLGRSDGAREVRQSLLRFFSHRTCATLVRPATEEAQLQRLDTMPYKQLRSEFRAGVEALRQQLVSQAMSNPKTVGGQPLTCFAFVALLKQFVTALNDKKALSVKGAWETVQHTACGQLADELRDEACKALRTLRDGGELQGRAKLPLSDEALRTVLRAQRHDLKSKWEERAVGDELVRKEYWQELKESLAREEKVVQVQNGRVADDALLTSMKGWQEWLDSSTAGWADAERVINSTYSLAERTPSGSLARGMRSAMESAGRRVVATRHERDATVKQSDEEKQKALKWGQEAAEKEGVARNELQERLKRLEDAETQLKDLEDSHHGTRAELESRHRELEEAKERYEAKMREVEENHNSHKRELEGKHSQAQDQLRYREQAYQNLESQLESSRAELTEAKAQVQSLIADMETARAREQELKASQRVQMEREDSLKAALEEARGQATKENAERLASERLARTAQDQAAGEKRQLEVDLEQSRAETDNYKAQLAVERTTLKDENEKTRAEHMRLVEETRKRMEEERKAHADTLQGEKDRLIDRERNTGVLEGQVKALSSENTMLRDQLAELREQLRETEREKGQHAEEKSRLQTDLDKNKQDLDQKLKDQAAEHEKMVQDLQAQASKQKCGCTVM